MRHETSRGSFVPTNSKANICIASTMLTAGSLVGDDTSGPLPARTGAIAPHCIIAIADPVAFNCRRSIVLGECVS